MEIKVFFSNENFFKCSSLWIFIGLLISFWDKSLDNNYIHVIVVNLILLLEILAIKEIYKEEEIFKQNISGLVISNNYNLMANYNKLNMIFSKLYFKLLSIIVGILYLFFLISLNILNMNTVIFYYGAITLIITVYYAIRLYFKYLFYIYFIYKISKQKFSNINYNRLIPNRTKWIISITDLMNKFKYYFSILGIMYTLEYLFTMDKRFFTLNGNHIVITTPNDYMFIVSWLIIFFLIGVGYFAYSKIIQYYIIKIIKQYENITLKEYESENKLYKHEKMNEYIQIYKLYTTNNKYVYSDTFMLEHLLPYIPIVLNVYKFLNIFSIFSIFKY